MIGPGRWARWGRLGRTLWVALLLSSLSLSAFDLHRAGDRHGDSLEAEWSARTTTLTHGGRMHVCGADVIVQRPCPACLHRLLTSGAHLLGVALPFALGVAGFVPTPERSLSGRLALASHPARGPPSR